MNIVNFDTDVDMNMSSLRGYVTTTYDKLVEVFGEPTYTDADPYEKVNAEWTVQAETDEGELVKFSIYNWKTGSIPTEEYDWHIGGYNYNATEVARAVIGE